MLERFLIFLMIIFTIGLSAGVSSARQAELRNNYSTSVQNIGSSRKEVDWLAHKETLVVDTWLPEASPVVYQNGGEYYRGADVDYFVLMQKNLNPKIIIKQYDNEQEAQIVPVGNDVDTLIIQLSRRQSADENLLRTSALLTTWSILVVSLKNTLLPLTTNHQVSVARIRDRLSIGVI